MYLMNVPTVAAPHTEWRACGRPVGFSIPVCFNDSDTELSTGGSPIANKVQMIIESLRSSQSSLDMSDQVEGNVLQGQDGPPQACKAAVDSLVVAKTKNCSTDVTFKDGDQSSDSDDSVDKGIEEAILEYLKEKDGHKRKAEPFVPSSRQTVPEMKSEGQAFSLMRSHLSKSVIQATQATAPVKKYIKHKASLHEAAVGNSELARIMIRDQMTNKSNSVVRNIKVEDASDDSSDDGIEEAIQRYQLERTEQQTRGDAFKPLASVEESDSSSDDGIEEAIRSYQLEQLRDKNVPKSQDKLAPNASGSAGLGKLKRKNKPAEKTANWVQPPFPILLDDSLNVSQRSEGNGFHLLRTENFTERPVPVLPKANTTAELMCAEAILDISKTVMPEAFASHLDMGPSGCALAIPAPLSTTPKQESDGSSVDSEDGIEQEIMKFLEQKAQMLQRPPEEPSTTQEVTQKKSQRLSLTKRRKSKDDKSSSASSIGSSTNPLKAQSPPEALERSTEKSGDKSSSLDSDEDLDTAIKALLKTKKKSKKMSRSERDSRKRPTEKAEQSRAAAKKAKVDHLAKLTVLKKGHKRKSDSPKRTALPNASPIIKRQTSRGENDVRGHPPTTALQIKEDSSSVDSDDSIEQEIRKFLAEKAEKVSERTNDDAEAPRNGTADCAPLPRDLEQDDQLAEIPTQSVNTSAPPQDKAAPSAPDSPAVLAVTPQWSCNPRTSPWSGRAEQKPVTPARVDDGQTEKVSALDQSIKWRQSFGLPIVDPKNFNRTSFHISTSATRASPSPASLGKPSELKPPTPASLWSSAKRSWSTDRTPRAPVTSGASKPFAADGSAGQRPGAASTVHVPRDKSVFVELESGRTNHVQVQSRQSDEGEARADQSRALPLEGADEKFIDESEGETPEKKQSTLSLSYTLDPGIVIRPCIALCSEERSIMFRNRFKNETCKMPNVKRRLQFIPVHR
ncbi:protein phosphatase 1 regulatory subunit 26 [Syngnathus scovelli]|uniref:protein phosphatase 1 regulatory subunit 26 n=1 Tax=Syngnathus scovelli TaxID=161590 RepID=UPI00210F6847|nr:protein phosphatase 1 regulatory subunit 26 [Syngnathus scovelli]